MSERQVRSGKRVGGIPATVDRVRGADATVALDAEFSPLACFVALLAAVFHTYWRRNDSGPDADNIRGRERRGRSPLVQQWERCCFWRVNRVSWLGPFTHTLLLPARIERQFANTGP